MNIILIGYRAAGKSAVGRRLAARMGKEFVDTDEIIEKKQGISIHDIVEYNGWDCFRALEKGTIKEISREGDLVIAPGGGAVIDPENLRALKENGLIIWLQADRETLCRRMEKDSQTLARRPSLTGKSPLEEFGEIMVSRDPLYEKAADGKLDTSLLDIEAVVKSVLRIVADLGKSRQNDGCGKKLSRVSRDPARNPAKRGTEE